MQPENSVSEHEDISLTDLLLGSVADLLRSQAAAFILRPSAFSREREGAGTSLSLEGTKAE